MNRTDKAIAALLTFAVMYFLAHLVVAVAITHTLNP